MTQLLEHHCSLLEPAAEKRIRLCSPYCRLPRYLPSSYHLRKHSALSWQSAQQRLVDLLC